MLASCNSKNDTVNISDVTLRMIQMENNRYNTYLTENIQNNIKEKKNLTKVKIYDSLTINYLKYITDIQSEIKEKSTDILFDGDKYSKKGKEFVNTTKTYKEAIENLTDSQNLKKRINLVLNTNDIPLNNDPTVLSENNETGDIKPNGQTYVFYLDYYYKGFSAETALAFIDNKKRSILELENEFIIFSSTP